MFNWQWLVKDQTIQTVLDGVITQDLELKPRQLRADLTDGELAADFEDLEHFNRFSDYLSDLDCFSEEQIRTAALHGSALLKFGKSLMPQSWYFQVSAYEPEEHAMTCMLNSGFEQGNFLILERDSRSCLCMLLDETCEIDVSRELRQFEVIRVLNDRVQPCIWKRSEVTTSRKNLA